MSIRFESHSLGEIISLQQKSLRRACEYSLISLPPQEFAILIRTIRISGLRNIHTHITELTENYNLSAALSKRATLHRDFPRRTFPRPRKSSALIFSFKLFSPRGSFGLEESSVTSSDAFLFPAASKNTRRFYFAAGDPCFYARASLALLSSIPLALRRNAEINARGIIHFANLGEWLQGAGPR